MAKSPVKARSKNSGSIWKKQGKFCLTVRAGGKSKTTILRNPDGTPCTTRQQADAAANLAQSALSIESRERLAAFTAESRKLKVAAMPLALADVWAAFLKLPNRTDPSAATLRGYRLVVNAFVAWTAKRGIRNLTDITPAIAAEFLNDVAGGLSPRRWNEYVTVLKMVFSCLNEYLADVNPFAGFKRKLLETVKHEPLSPEQIRLVLSSFDRGLFHDAGEEPKGEAVLEWVPLHAPEMRCLFHVLVFTGVRLGDACRLRWSDVNFDDSTLQIVPAKTRRRANQKVVIPIHSDLQKELVAALQWRDDVKKDAFVMPNISSRYVSNPTGLSKNISRIIGLAIGEETRAMPDGARRKNRACVYSAHSLRHGFVSFLAMSNTPLAIIQALAGHSSAAMSLYYQHADAGGKLKAIQSLPCMNTANGENGRLAALQARVRGLVDGASIAQLEKAIAALEK